MSELELHVRLERMLTSRFGRIEVDADGDLTYLFGSTRVYVHIIDQAERQLIKVWAPVLRGVPPSPELFRHVAMHTGEYYFGGFDVTESDDGLSIDVYHTLLGDYVDPEEIQTVLIAVGELADRFDDELQQLFGGRTYRDLTAPTAENNDTD